MVRLKGGVCSLATYVVLVILIYLFVVKPLVVRILETERPLASDPLPADILDNMNLSCTTVLKGWRNNGTAAELLDERLIEDRLLYSTDRCRTLRSMYRFQSRPLSEGERNYPLAYGMLVYRDLPQVLFLLSAVYHPQNEYCIAVGENSALLFQHLLKELSTCFPNVHFMTRPPINWGGHEIINSAFECLRFLSHLKSEWRYFQYLSGVDVPLRTNSEMVEIFKVLNGTANVEVKKYQTRRLKGKKENLSPLPLFKSSLSALIPREAANQLASSNLPQELLEFLRNTGIADEGFWGTLLGNKDKFNIPGALNFKEWIDYVENSNLTWGAHRIRYYISRDQVWTKRNCHNYISSGSCVFGVGDVPRLLKSKALIAHKFYLRSEPDAYFCMLKEHRRRTDNPDPDFDVSIYSELPQLELARGVNFSQITNQNSLL